MNLNLNSQPIFFLIPIALNFIGIIVAKTISDKKVSLIRKELSRFDREDPFPLIKEKNKQYSKLNPSKKGMWTWVEYLFAREDEDIELIRNAKRVVLMGLAVSFSLTLMIVAQTIAFIVYAFFMLKN